MPLIAQYSIWWPLGYAEQIDPQFIDWAKKLHNIGIRCWNDLWDTNIQTWVVEDTLIQRYRINNEDWQLIQLRITQLEFQHHCKAGIMYQISLSGVG